MRMLVLMKHLIILHIRMLKAVVNWYQECFLDYIHSHVYGHDDERSQGIRRHDIDPVCQNIPGCQRGITYLVLSSIDTFQSMPVLQKEAILKHQWRIENNSYWELIYMQVFVKYIKDIPVYIKQITVYPKNYAYSLHHIVFFLVWYLLISPISFRDT